MRTATSSSSADRAGCGCDEDHTTRMQIGIDWIVVGSCCCVLFLLVVVHDVRFCFLLFYKN